MWTGAAGAPQSSWDQRRLRVTHEHMDPAGPGHFITWVPKSRLPHPCQFVQACLNWVSATYNWMSPDKYKHETVDGATTYFRKTGQNHIPFPPSQTQICHSFPKFCSLQVTEGHTVHIPQPHPFRKTKAFNLKSLISTTQRPHWPLTVSQQKCPLEKTWSPCKHPTATTIC